MHRNKGDFFYDNAEGRIGEEFCISYLKLKYSENSIFDVSNVILFQLLDIDFVLGKTPEAIEKIANFLYSDKKPTYGLIDILKSDEIITIEVKTDTRTCGLHPTGNIVFETVSKRSPGTYNTRADYVFYVCSRETGEKTGVFDISSIYIVDMCKLREWHYKNHSSVCKTFVYDKNIDFRFPVNRLISDGIVKRIPERFYERWKYTINEIQNANI